MLYREIITVCSQIHTKHINTPCGQNVDLLCVKLVVHTATTGLIYDLKVWASMDKNRICPQIFTESITFHINHFLTVYAQILGNRRTDRYDLNARYSSI